MGGSDETFSHSRFCYDIAIGMASTNELHRKFVATWLLSKKQEVTLGIPTERYAGDQFPVWLE